MARSLAWLLLSVGFAVACGGRYSHTEGGEDGGAQSAGGTASAGSAGRGGSSSRAGAPTQGGGPASGGQPAAGGACSCGALPCPGSFVPVPTPDGCCFTCQPFCNTVACPGVACPSGFHLEVEAGACCPTCRADVDICANSRKEYFQFRQQLLEKYGSMGCMTDGDCGLYYDKNECSVSCGTSVPIALISNLDDNLRSYAEANCGGCGFPGIPPCMPSSPRCLSGRCQ